MRTFNLITRILIRNKIAFDRDGCVNNFDHLISNYAHINICYIKILFEIDTFINKRFTYLSS